MAKVAVIGNITGWSYPEVEAGLKEHLSKGDELFSTGAKGVGTCVRFYAKKNNVRLTEVLPNFQIDREIRYSIRNQKLVEVTDKLIAFDKGLFKTAVTDAIAQAEMTEKEVIKVANAKVVGEQLDQYLTKVYEPRESTKALPSTKTGKKE